MKISNWVSKLLVGRELFQLTITIAIGKLLFHADSRKKKWSSNVCKNFAMIGAMHMIFNILWKYFLTVSKLSFRNNEKCFAPPTEMRPKIVTKSIEKLKSHLKREKCCTIRYLKKGYQSTIVLKKRIFTPILSVCGLKSL